MKRLDRQTVQRIIDAADIVEVVSDYVTLKKRGANYMGLCPFHNERTPSFSVSKAKGICKCFSCGKGGSPLNFIMEIEQIGYYEALKHLAKKYGIEIQERELTDDEQKAESEREAMFAINDFAMKHFEHNLKENDDGRNIGLAYFRERGISDAMIEKFRLGYSLDRNTDLYDTALRKGYPERMLLETGLCSKNDQGRPYDRFRGRVMYPIFTVSGKVVGYGGRTLRSDKAMAKYVNSPESLIYVKRSELYGLYQAKQAINRKDKCILVEGYMDVISMYQSGIENVVASSGTSLTYEQITRIHRFTSNVTVIYDSDAAGIKASLRGINMLLEHGLNVKVVQFPPGEDPDSFAQSHSASELEAYLNENEVDFISFKTRILLDGAENDPRARAEAIADIVESVSFIPDEITRVVYIKDCARRLGIDDGTIALRVKDLRLKRREKSFKDKKRAEQPDAPAPAETPENPEPIENPAPPENLPPAPDNTNAAVLRPFELNLAQYIARYGLYILPKMMDADGNTLEITVLQYILDDLELEGLAFANADIQLLVDAATRIGETDFPPALDEFLAQRDAELRQRRKDGIEKISETATDSDAIALAEKKLNEELEEYSNSSLAEFRRDFLSQHLINEADALTRTLATNLISEKHTLSRIHSKFAPVASEDEQLITHLDRTLSELKAMILELRMKSLLQQINEASANGASSETLQTLMQDYMNTARLRNDFSHYLGDRVVTPLKH